MKQIPILKPSGELVTISSTEIAFAEWTERIENVSGLAFGVRKVESWFTSISAWCTIRTVLGVRRIETESFGMMGLERKHYMHEVTTALVDVCWPLILRRITEDARRVGFRRDKLR